MTLYVIMVVVMTWTSIRLTRLPKSAHFGIDWLRVAFTIWLTFIRNCTQVSEKWNEVTCEDEKETLAFDQKRPRSPIESVGIL
jgi:hypothetical protein